MLHSEAHLKSVAKVRSAMAVSGVLIGKPTQTHNPEVFWDSCRSSSGAVARWVTGYETGATHQLAYEY